MSTFTFDTISNHRMIPIIDNRGRDLDIATDVVETECIRAPNHRFALSDAGSSCTTTTLIESEQNRLASES